MSPIKAVLTASGDVRVTVSREEHKVIVSEATPKVITINRGPQGLSGALATEYFLPVTLSQAQIDSKSITLGATPQQPERVELSIRGACSQFYGDDYTIVGNTLSWNGLGLDELLLEAGDKVKIRFLV